MTVKSKEDHLLHSGRVPDDRSIVFDFTHALDKHEGSLRESQPYIAVYYVVQAFACADGMKSQSLFEVRVKATTR